MKTWILTCLVLHNIIIEIGEDLGIAQFSSTCASGYMYADRRQEGEGEEGEAGEEEEEEDEMRRKRNG